MQKLLFILILNISPGLKNNPHPVSFPNRVYDTGESNSCITAHASTRASFIAALNRNDYPPALLPVVSAHRDPGPGSPCSAESFANGQLVTNFYNTLGYDEGFDKLKKANVPGIGIEFATVFGINYTTGIPTALPMITTLSPNSVSVTINAAPANVLVTAIAHTHHNNVFPAPSAGDLYAFGNYARSHPDFLYYTLAANGSKYVLAVTNADSLSAFLKLYPQKINIEPDSVGNPGRGAGYNPGSELYLAMQKAANDILIKSIDPANPTPEELDAAHEAVQVYILDHFNTGMALFKQSGNGSFHELHSELDSNKTMSKVFACK